MNCVLELKGKQNFMEFEIPVIEGGFGEGQKTMLAKTVAEVHGTRLDKINALINEHIDEFEEGIDILDLKNNESFANLCKVYGLYSQNALNSSKNIYLLSEQGYMLLVGFMKTDKAKEIRKELRRSYFKMREIIKNETPQISLEEQLVLKVYNGGFTAIEATKELNKINYDKGYDKGLEDGKKLEFENVMNERMTPLLNNSELVKKINIKGLTTSSLNIFLCMRGLGSLKKTNKSIKFIPNERFEESIIKNSWAKYVGNSYKFYEAFADFINDNIKYYEEDLTKAKKDYINKDNNENDLPF